MTVAAIVQTLGLQPHPEGGFYKEVYRSADTVEASCLPKGFHGRRSFSTSIYYLLEKNDFSAFHRIKSDEIWHYHAGGNLLIHSIDLDGKYQCKILGASISEGATFQVMVPAGHWFASEPAAHTDFILAGCTVSPGFDFKDFELADKNKLAQEFPEHIALINRLCK